MRKLAGTTAVASLLGALLLVPFQLFVPQNLGSGLVRVSFVRPSYYWSETFGTALATPAPAPADLESKTLRAFERYVRSREAMIDGELGRGNPFLLVDGLPEARRHAAYAQLESGRVVIERLEVRDKGQKIAVPDGLIHHWIGTVFIPRATLERTLALAQDYDRHKVYFTPEVQRSKLLGRNGNEFRVYLRFVKKKIITVVLDTEHAVLYLPLSPTRMASRSHTTRIAEVQRPGAPDESEKPFGHDGGFLWGMNTYWLFEERDGGTYVQCETISLTRDIPILLTWLRPFLTIIPRESLTFTLGRTRALLAPGRPAGGPGGQAGGGRTGVGKPIRE
jgi:hypothetical protein